MEKAGRAQPVRPVPAGRAVGGRGNYPTSATPGPTLRAARTATTSVPPQPLHLRGSGPSPHADPAAPSTLRPASPAWCKRSRTNTPLQALALLNDVRVRRGVPGLRRAAAAGREGERPGGACEFGASGWPRRGMAETLAETGDPANRAAGRAATASYEADSAGRREATRGAGRGRGARRNEGLATTPATKRWRPCPTRP